MNSWWKYGAASVLAVACSAVVVVILLHPSKQGEAQTIDFWSLTAPRKQVFRDQYPRAFEPQVSEQKGSVLYVRTAIVGDPPTTERLYEAFATVRGQVAPYILTREVSSTGTVIAEQLTVNGRTTLEDGQVIGNGNPTTLGELLPAMDPEFARSVLHLSEEAASSPSTTFTVTAARPNDRFVREVIIESGSHVILSHRLMERKGSDDVLLDSTTVSYEWISMEKAPQALLEVTTR